MIRCIIIDDEEPAINVLKRFLERLPDMELVAATINPLEGIELVKSLRPDVVFLDIQMQEMDGMEVAKVICELTKIVFCTAYEGYAAQSYEVNAVDYLIKPIEFLRFKIAVQKVSDLLTGRSTPVEAIKDDYILVKTGERGKLQKIEIDDIVFIQALNNYVSFYCPPKKIIAYLSLKELEERLPPCSFVRVHKSYIIALKYIQTIDNNEVRMKKDALRIPIGATFKEMLLERIREKLL
jgi:DNA-binding LytR/AlgR family response regulator